MSQASWQHAIAIIDEWLLCPEDEQHDNQCPRQDGDGTTWNKALLAIRKRFEEEVEK
jgi:hypothetical protein